MRACLISLFVSLSLSLSLSLSPPVSWHYYRNKLKIWRRKSSTSAPNLAKHDPTPAPKFTAKQSSRLSWTAWEMSSIEQSVDLQRYKPAHKLCPLPSLKETKTPPSHLSSSSWRWPMSSWPPASSPPSRKLFVQPNPPWRTPGSVSFLQLCRQQKKTLRHCVRRTLNFNNHSPRHESKVNQNSLLRRSGMATLQRWPSGRSSHRTTDTSAPSNLLALSGSPRESGLVWRCIDPQPDLPTLHRTDKWAAKSTSPASQGTDYCWGLRTFISPVKKRKSGLRLSEN